MLRLNTLGGLTLQDDGQLHTGAAAQRRRLALLAAIAAAGRRGVSRDKLLGLLWPDREPEAGRHSLYQALHAIRRSVGLEDLLLGSATLQLNPERITSDVMEFEDAIDQGAHEEAVRLYRGPFLDGFRLDGAAEFEQWRDCEALRHAREYANALEALAAAATARDDHPAAVRWCRRLASAEPVSTRAALALIQALVAAGDRIGALQFANVHTSLVRQHLDADPDPAVEAWCERLRAGDLPAPVAVAAPARSRAPTTAHEARDAARHELDQITRVLADRYQVLAQAGSSAMLLNFSARDRRDTRQVDLHVLNPRLAALGRGDRVVEALERVAALREPRIVPVRDCGLVDSVVYFTTPPVEGDSLRDRLARDRQLPIDEAVRITGDLLDVLVYAHGRDVRHGDLRPKHILLTPGGVAVASFGLVEAMDLAVSGSAGSTAVTVGAPAYLSPEQLAGETIASERSDLYSLGCVIFEMLAGDPPFAGTSLASVLSRKLTQSAPPVLEHRDTVPPWLAGLVARCLERLPADRFQSAVAAREACKADA